MRSSRYVRFSGGPATPTAPVVNPSPGGPIVSHLTANLPPLGVRVLGHEDVEFAHELKCQVGARTYTVCVSCDWVDQGWWEVFWSPSIGLVGKLLGRSEDGELRSLAAAVARALASLPGIQERRWYRAYGVNTGPGAPYGREPDPE